jgi:hypothetical protein
MLPSSDGVQDSNHDRENRDTTENRKAGSHVLVPLLTQRAQAVITLQNPSPQANRRSENCCADKN